MMKTSKKMWLLAVLALISLSCTGQAATTNQTSGKSKTTVKATVITLSKAEFLKRVADVESSSTWKYLGDKPAIVDFYADWCGPCKMIAPILESLAKEYDGEIYIYKVNTDKERDLAAIMGIRSLPSLLFIPMKGQPQMTMGAAPKAEIQKKIDEFLLNKK